MNDAMLERLTTELREFPDNGGTAVELGGPIGLFDAVAFYRTLLGRSPSKDELHYLEWKVTCTTRRDLLREILASPEYGRAVPLLPAGHTWMAKLEKFSLWFHTADVEMGARMALGIYEPEVRRTVEEHVKEGMVAVDIGAQCGYYSLMLATQVGPRGKVIAIEPRPASIELVRRNIAQNGFSNVVQVLHTAASDSRGTLTMYETSGMYVAGNDAAASAVSVPCTSVDEIIESGAPVDFVKIDVEGHEPKVLSGMQQTLANTRPILLIELNEYWLQRNSRTSSAAVLEWLEQAGYAMSRVDNGLAVRSSDFTSQDLDNVEVLARPIGR
ncbi:MAG: FkbM family methyltransferase [Acidiferrobacterales bacterium]